MVSIDRKSGVSVKVPVEVTGFPALGRCAIGMLTRAPLIDADVTIKYVFYFEPTGSAADGQ
jgi:hypothetical protein